jgi:hypothetical protein
LQPSILQPLEPTMFMPSLFSSDFTLWRVQSGEPVISKPVSLFPVTMQSSTRQSGEFLIDNPTPPPDAREPLMNRPEESTTFRPVSELLVATLSFKRSSDDPVARKPVFQLRNRHFSTVQFLLFIIQTPSSLRRMVQFPILQSVEPTSKTPTLLLDMV